MTCGVVARRVPSAHRAHYPVLAWPINLLAYAMPSVPVPPITSLTDMVPRCRPLAAHGLGSCPSARTQPLTATGAPSQTSTMPCHAMPCHARRLSRLQKQGQRGRFVVRAFVAGVRVHAVRAVVEPHVGEWHALLPACLNLFNLNEIGLAILLRPLVLAVLCWGAFRGGRQRSSRGRLKQRSKKSTVTKC